VNNKIIAELNKKIIENLEAYTKYQSIGFIQDASRLMKIADFIRTKNYEFLSYEEAVECAIRA